VFGKGLPLEDMEFHQFHPTGLGILISEAVRGEGGRLLNAGLCSTAPTASCRRTYGITVAGSASLTGDRATPYGDPPPMEIGSHHRSLTPICSPAISCRNRHGATRRGDAGAKVRQDNKGPTDTLCDQYIMCPQSDSNRHLTDFKSAASANWAMGAARSLSTLPRYFRR
jgi:hypothetical protein